jgi:hypothetical protein
MWAALLLAMAVAACSDPVSVEHTISSGNHTVSSGNHTISSGNLSSGNSRQSRLQLPQTSADLGRRLDDAPRVR